MAIVASIRQFAHTLLQIAHTRLALASVEIEEELLRLASYLLLALLTLFFFGIALLLLIFLLIVLFWDSHRVTVVASLLGVFTGGALLLAGWLRYAWRNKPQLLQHTLAELHRDATQLQAENSHDAR